MPTPITVSVGNSFSWVESLKQKIQNANNQDIFLISQNLENTGVIGLTKGLRQEPNGKYVKYFEII